MNAKMTLRTILLITWLSTTVGSAFAVTLPGPVVSAAWLAEHKSEVQVVEVAGNVDSFMSQPDPTAPQTPGHRIVVDFGGHIEGSSLMDFSNVRVERNIGGKKISYLIPLQGDFENIVQIAGVRSDQPIVLVPFGREAGDLDEALRILWQFKVYGEKNIAILDGGLAGWLAEGRDVSAINTIMQKGNWVIKGYHKELVATSEDVAQASRTMLTGILRVPKTLCLRS
jgi:thiosulfate/3-mercaptopyruvate sulfurtransferase